MHWGLKAWLSHYGSCQKASDFATSHDTHAQGQCHWPAKCWPLISYRSAKNCPKVSLGYISGSWKKRTTACNYPSESFVACENINMPCQHMKHICSEAQQESNAVVLLKQILCHWSNIYRIIRKPVWYNLEFGHILCLSSNVLWCLWAVMTCTKIKVL